MAVERKYERDIDLLLAEEFSVSPAFASWFLQHTKNFKTTAAQVVEVFVSRSDVTGESDLVVIFREETGGRKFALHIEDKIDAPLQPEQLARYRVRAAAEVQEDLYAAFEVILCAPAGYYGLQSPEANFDSSITYEEIAEFLRTQAQGNLRGEYRACFVAAAATKTANAWKREDDCDTNDFWEKAFEIARADFLELEMKRLQLTKGSTWITFRPADMPTRPRKIYISFKGDRGYMDLTFSACVAHKFHAHVKKFLEKDMYVQKTGKATAIRIEVDSFEVCPPNEEVLKKVRGAFTACVRLIHFFRLNRKALEMAAAASLPDPGK